MESLKVDIEAEIMLRQAFADFYLSSGQKAYLVVRNLGTIGLMGSILCQFLGYSSVVTLIMMILIMVGIWIQDVMDFSRKGLAELMAIDGLRKLHEEVSLSQLEKNVDIEVFISDVKKSIELLTTGCVPVSQFDVERMRKKTN